MEEATLKIIMEYSIWVPVATLIILIFIAKAVDIYRGRIVNCSHCGITQTRRLMRSRGSMMSKDSEFYCTTCFVNQFNVCENCNKHRPEKLTEFDSLKICSRCMEKETHNCDVCNKEVGSWNMKKRGGIKYCIDCYDSRYRRFRRIEIPNIKIPSRSFDKNKFKRFCGVEIECNNRRRNKNSFTKKELRRLNFSQVRDASLGDGGVEFVSVPMNGDKLFNRITNLCREIKSRNYYVTRKCGLHTHLEVPQDLEYLKRIFIFYNKFEDVICKMVPKRRRNGEYSRKIGRVYKFNTDELVGTNSLDDLRRLIYGSSSINSSIRRSEDKYDSKRYCWVNIHSIFHRGTLEIRNHPGTIMPTKIKNWLTIHLTLLDFIERADIKTIREIKNDKETFLSLFDEKMQKYIKKRINKFSGQVKAGKGGEE